jgi:hypothetical protein
VTFLSGRSYFLPKVEYIRLLLSLSPRGIFQETGICKFHASLLTIPISYPYFFLTLSLYFNLMHHVSMARCLSFKVEETGYCISYTN